MNIAKQAALEALARRLLRLILDGRDPDVIRESAVEIVEEIDRC